MQDFSSVTAVVLGGDIGAYSVARAFFQATGNKPTIISAFGGGIVRDSSIARLIVEPQMEDREVLLRHLREIEAASNASHILAVASADWNVESLIALRDELPERFIVPYPDKATVARATDKASFTELCVALGIPHPRSVVRAPGGPIPADEEAITYPIVAKATDTPAYHEVEFAGKKKVFTFASPAEAQAALTAADAAGYAGDFLLQEYIPGPDSQMRVLNLYCQAGGKVVFAGLGRVLLEEHAPSAIGNSAAIITEIDEDIIAHASRIVEELGWHGFACFDIKVDPRTGVPMIFEMNARLGRAHHYLTAVGANPVEFYLRDYVAGEVIDRRYTVAKEGLYTVVPISLLMMYTPGERARIARLVASGRVASPLFNTAERSPKRWGYVLAAYVNQWRKFLRHHPPTKADRPGLDR